MASSTELSLDSKAWEDFIGRVRKKWDDVKNRKQFGAIVATVVYGDIMDHFEKEMGPGGAWAPWSKSYTDSIAGRIAFRRWGGRTVPIENPDKYGIKPPRRPGKKLQVTGRLRQSFKPTNWRAQNDGIMFFNNAKIKGSGFPYAAAHNDGGPRLPARPFMWLSAKGMVRGIKVVESWLADTALGG